MTDLRLSLQSSDSSIVDQWLKAEREGEQFPVDFDQAWQLAGYATKASAKRALENYLEKETDYLFDKVLKSTGGRGSEVIHLTCDALKELCMLSRSIIGKNTRKYFIEAEKALRVISLAQVEKEKPALGLADYIELKQKLDGLKQDRITELLNYRFVSELEGLNVNQRQLGTTPEQKHYQPCNLRAYDLGYKVHQVSNGTDLGRYVKKLVNPAFKDYQGQYHVWHYEVNNELDNAIHNYFRKDLNN